MSSAHDQTAVQKATRPRPVFIAALPREVALLVKQEGKQQIKGYGWRADISQVSRGIYLFEHPGAIVACAGMGARRASLAIEAALALGPASELVSVGWAGACNSAHRVGDLIDATLVIDAKTGERFFIRELAADVQPQVVVTVARPAGVTEKVRLNMSYYADAVDMEASAVARIAQARELPFSAIKAISDDAEFELPELERFSSPTGQFREAAFGAYVAVHPALWKPVAALARGSKLAAERLSAEISKRIASQFSSTS